MPGGTICSNAAISHRVCRDMVEASIAQKRYDTKARATGHRVEMPIVQERPLAIWTMLAIPRLTLVKPGRIPKAAAAIA
jgi:hypothetical protein